MGTACYVRGAPKILENIERELGIKAGETSPDLKYTLETVNCVGCCGLAPVVVINDKVVKKRYLSKTLMKLKTTGEN